MAQAILAQGRCIAPAASAGSASVKGNGAPGKGRSKGAKGKSKGQEFSRTREQLNHPSLDLMNLQSLATTLNWLSGQGPGNYGGKGRGGKGGKSNRQTGNAWGLDNSVQDSSHLTSQNCTGIKDEDGNQATMLNNRGEETSVKWICSQATCHYPHYGNRPTCSNCKAPRNRAQEPKVLVCSKINPENSQTSPMLTASAKARPGPSSSSAGAQEEAAASPGGTSPSACRGY